jgi:hypothetical protein
MTSIAAMLAELPTRDEWRAEFSSLRASIREAIAPRRPVLPRHRASIPMRTWHAGRLRRL